MFRTFREHSERTFSITLKTVLKCLSSFVELDDRMHSVWTKWLKRFNFLVSIMILHLQPDGEMKYPGSVGLGESTLMAVAGQWLVSVHSWILIAQLCHFYVPGVPVAKQIKEVQSVLRFFRDYCVLCVSLSISPALPADISVFTITAPLWGLKVTVSPFAQQSFYSISYVNVRIIHGAVRELCVSSCWYY